MLSTKRKASKTKLRSEKRISALQSTTNIKKSKVDKQNSAFTDARKSIVEGIARLSAKDLLGSNVSIKNPIYFSMRIAGTESFAILAVQKAKIARSDLPKLEKQVAVLAMGMPVPSIQSKAGKDYAHAVALHTEIYRQRSDVGAIAFTKQRWASALHLLPRAMPAVFDEQARQLGKRVDSVKFDKGEFDAESSKRLSSGANIFLFEEGVLCFGFTKDRAVFNSELIEKCAKAYSIAFATGRSVGTIPFWVVFIANGRLLKDEKKSATAYANGLIPTGFTAY